MSLASVLFPEPDGPTTPTICPAGTLKETSCSTSGPSMRYRKVTCSKATSPRTAGSAVRPVLKVGSAAVLRMSPSRATDRRAWWKSCQIWASRSTGALTRPASRLKATSSPTDRPPSITRRAEIEDAAGGDLADELHQLARAVAEVLHAEARADVAGELLLPAALHLRLDRHRLERLDAGHALDQEGLVLGAAAEFLVEPAAEERRRGGRDRDIERQRAEHDAGQERRVDEHHGEEDRGEQEIDDEGQRRAGEEVADILQLAHPRDRIADP